MKLNRILTAIAEWINSVVWWRKGEVKHKPYETLHTHRVEGAGIILLVRRNPETCPRDVGTIIWFSIRGSQPSQTMDCHICIDHLEGMARSRDRYTHQITISLADHWPDKDGLYNYEPLFSAMADLQGQSVRRDIHTRKILTILARPLAYQSPAEINWDLQLQIAMKSCGLTAPSPTGTVLAHGLSANTIARINLNPRDRDST